MAQQGFYKDPPSRRMAYDADGTIVMNVETNLNSAYEYNTTEKQAMNDEGQSLAGGGNLMYLTFIFPEKRTITHFFHMSTSSGGPGSFWDRHGGRIAWSNDTSTGRDGNWTQVAASHNNNYTSRSYAGYPYVRDNIETLSVPNVRAIRFEIRAPEPGYYSTEILTFHLYGYKSAGETPHRIDFCDIDGSELVQDFDFGDQPRNTNRIWTPSTTYNQGSGLYLRNKSIEKVANDVILSTQSLTSDMHSRIGLSKDNATFGSQVSFAEIQPQQIVGPVYVRHSTTSTTPMGLYTSRMRLKVGAWL